MAIIPTIIALGRKTWSCHDIWFCLMKTKLCKCGIIQVWGVSQSHYKHPRETYTLHIIVTQQVPSCIESREHEPEPKDHFDKHKLMKLQCLPVSAAQSFIEWTNCKKAMFFFLFSDWFMSKTIWNPKLSSCYAWLLLIATKSQQPTSLFLLRLCAWPCLGHLQDSLVYSPSHFRAKSTPGIIWKEWIV